LAINNEGFFVVPADFADMRRWDSGVCIYDVFKHPNPSCAFAIRALFRFLLLSSPLNSDQYTDNLSTILIATVFPVEN
jgi:hypothetical protein